MAKRPSLSTVVAGDLKEMIRRKGMKAGDRIPTEAELCLMHNVSRTVIREAIMRLRSEGTLVARQGIGVFVGEKAPQRFEVDWSTIRTLPGTIMLVELRMAVEVESAGLCALRRTRKEAVEIRRLMEKVDARHDDPKSTSVFYDHRFHLAIARAARNPYILQLLELVSPIIRTRVKLGALVDQEHKDAYYRMIHEEHDRIVVAIERSDEAAARKHMRAHIEAGIGRLRDLAARLPKDKEHDLVHADATLIERLIEGFSEDRP